MYEYVEGEAMYPHITTPNTRFSPHKYVITVLTDDSTASELEAKGISQVRDKTGQAKFDKPAFSFSRKVEIGGRINEAPKLIDNDGNPMDVAIGNGSKVKVKIKPYKNDYGTFAELIAVKVVELVEYAEQSADNEEF